MVNNTEELNKEVTEEIVVISPVSSTSSSPVRIVSPTSRASPETVSSYPAAELEQIKRLIDEEANSEINSDEEFFDADDDVSDEESSSSDSDQQSEDEVELVQNEKEAEDWTLQRRGPRPPVFTSREEIRVSDDCIMPIDFFKVLFTEQILKQIVDSTNECAAQTIAQCTTPEARIRRWKPLSVEKLLTFIGILFHMGHIKLNRFSDYWRNHYLFNLFTHQFMSKTEFLLIFRCLRFGQHNLENLVTYFNDKMTELYSPGEKLLIDQCIILSRRSGIYQNILSQTNKCDIKLHMLAVPSGLFLKMCLCKGKPGQEVEGKDSTDRVVTELLKNYLGLGHHVYMDSFYNSVGLSEFLLDSKTNVTGTLKAKRKGNPAVLTTKLRKGGNVFRYNKNGVCVCKWRDQHYVLDISTIYSSELKLVTNKRGQKTLQPEMVIEYNKFMSSVNKQNQMLAYYTGEHKTMRWYKKVGIHILQMMMQNAYYLYQMKLNKKIDFLKFREDVITTLLPSPPPDVVPPPSSNGVGKEATIHLPAQLPKDNKGNIKRRRCKHCWDTTNKRVNTVCYCPLCHNQPGLCLECFRAFHKY